MASAPTEIADGAWKITRGVPLRINVFFVREDGGVAVFDAGHAPMGAAVRAAADALGGATRLVLGNPHADHRGGARAGGAPIHSHGDDPEDVAGCRSSRAPSRAGRSPRGTAGRCRSPPR